MESVVAKKKVSLALDADVAEFVHAVSKRSHESADAVVNVLLAAVIVRKEKAKKRKKS